MCTCACLYLCVYAVQISVPLCSVLLSQICCCVCACAYVYMCACMYLGVCEIQIGTPKFGCLLLLFVDLLVCVWYMRVCVHVRACMRFALDLKSSITGWPRLIGSPKLQILFRERATKYRSLLRKMTYKDKGSYESSPPCIENLHFR